MRFIGKKTYNDTLMLQGFQDIKQEMAKGKPKKRKSAPNVNQNSRKKSKIVTTALRKMCSGVTYQKGATTENCMENKSTILIPQGT